MPSCDRQVTQPDALVDAALAADRAGDLDEARTLIQRHQSTLSSHSPLAARSQAFRVEAKVLRHRHDAASLQRACDAASHAVRLAQLPGSSDGGPGTALAQLELASCLLACDRFTEGAELAVRWADDPDATVAGWAWTLLGEANLGRHDHFAAIAMLMNALAEFRRANNRFRELTTRIALAAALDRAGRISEAAAMLGADAPHWTGEAHLRRTSIAHHLVHVENQHRTGDLATALRTLQAVDDLLQQCTGMAVAEVRLHRQFAACLSEWGQIRDASRHLNRAQRIVSRIAQPVVGLDKPHPLPPLSPPLRLPAIEQHTAINVGLHARLAADTAEVTARVARRSGGTAPLMAVEPAGPDGPATVVSRLLDDARLPGTLNDQGVALILRRLASLQGVPGQERAEATLLVEAGSILRGAGPSALLAAERCLRRAQVRLENLAGMDIWQARNQIELARTLRDGGRLNDALDCALTGVQGLDQQRFAMSKRRLRDNWLGAETHRAFELAIELAVECGREDLASDLIIFSRTAGIVVAQKPGADLGERDDIPLLPVPHLVCVDGTESALGSGGCCRYE